MDTINRYLNEGRSLDELFRADAFIFMDGLASDVYHWYDKGLTDDEIKNKLNEKNPEFNLMTILCDNEIDRTSLKGLTFTIFSFFSI